eukprot:scaffold1216_cov357-Prasinococcus_capsulatus_cf.AAC.6
MCGRHLASLKVQYSVVCGPPVPGDNIGAQRCRNNRAQACASPLMNRLCPLMPNASAIPGPSSGRNTHS